MLIKGELSSGRIWLDGLEVFPSKSQALINHSPTGFSYGYRGSGCSQLALAILLEVTNDEKFSKAYYRDFRDVFIANLPQEDFEGIVEIENWIREKYEK